MKVTAHFLLFAIFLGLPSVTAAEIPFSQVSVILANRCVDCHSGDDPAGKIDFTAFANQRQAIEADELWERVHEVLRGGTMPPEDEEPLTEAEEKTVQGWFHQTFESVTEIVPGHAPLRRLTRREYQNSIEALLGIQLHQELAKDGFRFMKPPPTIVEKMLPTEPPGGSGFSNDAAVLNLDQTMLLKMLQIAQYSVDQIDSFDSSKELVFAEDTDPAVILNRFLRRAYRRDVQQDEVTKYLQIYHQSRDSGTEFQVAIKDALVAILTSPHFLFRFERKQAQAKAHYRITESELATRLSYFLWSSPPDEALLELAIAGKLSAPETLTAQIKRMLVSPRIREFSRNFAGEWLGFHEVISDQVISSGNNNLVKQRLAMYDEALFYFEYLVKENRSIFEVIDSKETYLNKMLAGVYGVKGFKSPVQLRLRGREDAPDPLVLWKLTNANRGGYLTMAASMAITSAPQRTSPIRRGVWVLDKILGTPVPEPPPVVPPLEEARVAGRNLSVREQLELHTTKADCKKCHQHIDPLGLGLENFGPLGRFRTNNIDASGTLPSGQSFSTPAELKEILIRDHREQIRRNVTRRMLAYALGRRLRYYDKPVIQDLIKQLEAGDDQFHTLVKSIVVSVPFQYRAPAAHSEPSN